MPDINNRYVIGDLRVPLGIAELRIAQFKPPAAGPDPPPSPPGIPTPVDLGAIQREVAAKSAEERTAALFNFLVHLITQGSSDEISRQQIFQRITNLEARLAVLEAGRVPVAT